MRVPLRTTLPDEPRPERSAVGRWLLEGAASHERGAAPEKTHPWWQVLWLTGVDYYSTLGYAPGIALLAAGALAPLATGVLVLVTVLGALPIYAQVAKRSWAGQGSIAMLEHLLPSWSGKLLVLVLLGFAATDFVITMTLSAADAARHATENPLFGTWLAGADTLVTLALLVLLAVVFLLGFSEAIGLATLVAVPYLGVTLVVLVRGLQEVLTHPDLVRRWLGSPVLHADPTAVALATVLVFPRLALGLSGFETGVSVMPLVSGGADQSRRERRGKETLPTGRVRNTRKLLATAALLMSVMLALSSLVTTILIPEQAYADGGPASGRAIAFLAHQLFSTPFATVYDILTILILWFAGASAMAGLLHLVPRYLPRFGMAPEWASAARPLVLVLLAINVVVTLVFRANVEAQSGAYATGVLVLILSAALATTLGLWKEHSRPSTAYFGILTLAFAYTLVANCIERPDGLIIGSLFIVLVLVLSAVSRSVRSMELRIGEGVTDEVTSDLLKSLTGKKVHIVPLSSSSDTERARKAAHIHAHYKISGPLLFIHAQLLDNRSEFLAPLEVHMEVEGENYVAQVTGAVSIANTIAFFSELLDPVSVFFTLSQKSMMYQAFRFLLWGEGEVGLMAYWILQRYWDATPGEDIRPNIFLLSEEATM